jgi:pyrroloquinoline-quinone synthase
MDKARYQESLLKIMETKNHWAWPGFTSGMVPKEAMHIHFEQEFEVYVRDFPTMIARALVQCRIPEVRQELVENLYEEETGGLAAGRPHPELFLLYPSGLGCDMDRFNQIKLLPESLAYRAFLDQTTTQHGWEIATAITTIFIEGTPYERGELDENAEKRPELDLSEHPLVKHYGLSEEHLALTKAHRLVEGEHRSSAWNIVLDHIDASKYQDVVAAMEQACALWKFYRDGVARACGLAQNSAGEPELKS